MNNKPKNHNAVDISVETVGGWSGYLKTVSNVVSLNEDNINDVFKISDDFIGRGHGCSFGDQSILDNGIVLESKNLKNITWINKDLIEVGAGVEIRELLTELLPRKKTLIGIPGGLQVTIGGAISNNIHGKDHWKNGNFSENVNSVKIIDTNGNVKVIKKNDNLFKYIVGGLGLFGFILSAQLITKNISSSWVEENSIKLSSRKDFEKFFSSLKNGNLQVDYAVAWLDFSKKKHLGRGIALTGRFVDGEEVSSDFVKEKTKFNNYVFKIFHQKYFWYIAKFFYNRMNLNVLNNLKYNFTSKVSSKKLFYTDYMWIDNKIIPEYRKIYKPKNFIEIQPLVNISNGFDQFFDLLDFIKDKKLEPLFPSVKLHKKHDDDWTFAGEGLSICIDIPLDKKNFTSLVNELYEFLTTIDARIYLAKDSTLKKKYVEKLAPGLLELFSYSKQLNQDKKFISNMATRLNN